MSALDGPRADAEYRSELWLASVERRRFRPAGESFAAAVR
jgi:hypothetical protein